MGQHMLEDDLREWESPLCRGTVSQFDLVTDLVGPDANIAERLP